MTTKTAFSHPSVRGDGYVRWVIPSDAWNEDTIIIQLDTSENRWSGRTEFDQCGVRDLNESEIMAIRKEYGLTSAHR